MDRCRAFITEVQASANCWLLCWAYWSQCPVNLSHTWKEELIYWNISKHYVKNCSNGTKSSSSKHKLPSTHFSCQVNYKLPQLDGKLPNMTTPTVSLISFACSWMINSDVCSIRLYIFADILDCKKTKQKQQQ